ncbi:MAG: hypothetical protein ACRDKT_07770 [Actinomycetota bacterium]
MSRRLWPLVVVAGLLASACATVPSATPNCDANENTDVLVIEAQSVPSAEHLPCVGALPVGWSLHEFDATDDYTRFFLDSDRAGFHAVKVELRPSCDIGRATEVPPDTPGIEQFERIDTLEGRYRGTRFYVFEGGCVTYDFDLSGEGRTELAHEVSLALDFFPRAELERMAAEANIDIET